MVSVYDSQGKKYFSEENLEFSKINLNTLSNGLYFFYISTNMGDVAYPAEVKK